MVFRDVLLVAASTLWVSLAAQAQELPAGQGKAQLESACTQCHAAEVIIGQPRTRDDWTAVLARMIGSGAQLSDEEYRLVLDYLSTHFGLSDQRVPEAKTGPSAPLAGPGK